MYVILLPKFLERNETKNAGRYGWLISHGVGSIFVLGKVSNSDFTRHIECRQIRWYEKTIFTYVDAYKSSK